jgi:hypothetical protein
VTVPEHNAFWELVLSHFALSAVVTTNYDLLAERGLRHRPMQRPKRPGIHYGGLIRPKILKGTALPFSVIKHRRRQPEAPETLAADRPHQRPLRPLRDRLWPVSGGRARLQGPRRLSSCARRAGSFEPFFEIQARAPRELPTVKVSLTSFSHVANALSHAAYKKTQH